MKRFLFMVVFLMPGLNAIAQEGGLAAVSSLKVDLEKVVEFGTVSPVDGITSSGQPDEAALADGIAFVVVDLYADVVEKCRTMHGRA